MRDRLLTLSLGVLMGAVLSRIGFSSWDEVHAMFTFADLRMFLAFCTAVAVLALAWPLFGKVLPGRPSLRRRPIHPGTVAGGLLFGMGWAICGACPSICMVQLGEGQLAAGWTLLGIAGGNYLYSVVHQRFFRWDVGSCTDD